MTRLIKQTLTALALAGLLAPGLAAAQDAAQDKNAQPKETVKATIGAWEVRCSPEDGKRCVMAQLGKSADGKTVMEVRIRKLDDAKTKDGKPIPAAIQITTPLGSLLRAGVTVKVDSGEPRAGLFEVCVPAGCVVRDPVGEELLANLKAGANAVMTFVLLQKGEVSANISLKGFTKAFNAL